MAQPTHRIITKETINQTDWRNQWIEVGTSPNDFATGESSLLLATVPFLPEGDYFTDVDLYPLGLTQNFAYQEGVSGAMVPELGSSRKTNTVGVAMGSGSIQRLLIHGNSLAAALFRPALKFMAATESLSGLANKIMSPSGNTEWIKGLLSADVDMWNAEVNEHIDRVISTGGMNSLLYKLPFGIVDVKRDPRQRVIAINFFEQCAVRGTQGGQSAGQFQIIESFSFEFERMRALAAFGPFSVSNASGDGLPG